MRWGRLIVGLAIPLCLGACGTHTEAARRVSVADGEKPPMAASRPLPSPDMLAVGDEDGTFVGYVHRSDIHPMSYERVNARTLWPVTDWDGNVVGYVAPDVPFVSMAQTQQPGF